MGEWHALSGVHRVVNRGVSVPPLRMILQQHHVTERLLSEYIGALKDLGVNLSIQQVNILLLVKEGRPQHLTTMASRLGVHRSTVTRLVDQLVAKGLLARVQSPDDGRALNLEMTPQADEAWENVIRAAEDLSNAAFDGIRPHDLQRLFDRLDSNLES